MWCEKTDFKRTPISLSQASLWGADVVVLLTKPFHRAGLISAQPAGPFEWVKTDHNGGLRHLPIRYRIKANRRDR
jgi:hypothetical protein